MPELTPESIIAKIRDYFGDCSKDPAETKAGLEQIAAEAQTFADTIE